MFTSVHSMTWRFHQTSVCRYLMPWNGPAPCYYCVGYSQVWLQWNIVRCFLAHLCLVSLSKPEHNWCIFWRITWAFNWRKTLLQFDLLSFDGQSIMCKTFQCQDFADIYKDKGVDENSKVIAAAQRKTIHNSHCGFLFWRLKQENKTWSPLLLWCLCY